MVEARTEVIFARLGQEFGERVRMDVPLAPYTSARIGGPADILLTVRSRDELAAAARILWSLDAPFRVLGAGSNVLVSDEGYRGVVVLNQAREVRFERHDGQVLAFAESGASLGALARRCVERGLAGLEWAATVPGTVGGALVGNAGAHGGDIAGSLAWAELLLRSGQVQRWDAQKLGFGYRTSILKRQPGAAVVLEGVFRLHQADPQALRKVVDGFITQRRDTQPSGASMGSMFKNPPGDAAGRLIDAAGLKGLRVGGAQVSTKHANFFINLGEARASDVWALIQRVRREVERQFGVRLELEIELLGAFEAPADLQDHGESE
jgi:UDP-N-acetylmuramate dehydrogenase